MANKTVKIDQLADAVMEGLLEYHDLAADEMKKAVKKAGKSAKEQISTTAPKLTGRYAKSWNTKTMSENSTSIELVVHSKNRYQLTHLLENGHAKRGGGRVRAIPHIAPAEEAAAELLESEIISALERG